MQHACRLGRFGEHIHHRLRQFTYGIGLELDAIAVVVIGGTLLTGGRGHMFGTLCGFLIIGTIQSAIDFDGSLSSWWTRIITGGLLLAFILLQRLLLRATQKRVA